MKLLPALFADKLPRDGHTPISVEIRPRRGPLRLLIFPLLLNVWPLLLLVSQKALVPFGLLLLGPGSRRTRSNFVSAMALLSVGGLLLTTQSSNAFSIQHFVGFALFVLSVPLINAAVRTSRPALINWLSVLSTCNAALAFGFYFLEIDLSQFRGLNRIIGDDDATHRVFFETTSLLAVFSVSFLRHRVIRWFCVAIVAAYALLLAKSIFVVLLFLLNHLAPRMVSGSLTSRIATATAFILVLVGAPALVALARPDFALSIGIKALQFDAVLKDSSPLLTGHGWGYAIDEIVNSRDQPYQVEMQLPMLLKQVGLIVVLSLAAFILSMFISISGTWRATSLRIATYFAIGFANPWLFIPSWYLTVALMYRQFDDPLWPR